MLLNIHILNLSRPRDYYCCQKRLSSKLLHCALHTVAFQDRRALWSILLPWLIHECRCPIYSRHLQCYLKICYIHGALQSGYATMHNALIQKTTFFELVNTAVSKKVVIVNTVVDAGTEKNSWGSSSTNNLLLIVLTLQNIECRFIMMPRPYSNNLHSPVFTHYDCTQSSFRFQYRLLTMTTFSEIAVYTKDIIIQSQSTCSNLQDVSYIRKT